MTARHNPVDEWLALALATVGALLTVGILYAHWPVHTTLGRYSTLTRIGTP